VPLQFVSEYDITKADREAKMVMLAGYARTPFEAKKLMEKHKVTTARELLPLLPPLRRRVNFFSQLSNIIMRIEGTRRGVNNKIPKESSKVWIKYRYRGRDGS